MIPPPHPRHIQPQISRPRQSRLFDRKCCGFTIVELLTVIAIIGILLSIMVPAVGRVRRTAFKTKEKSNIRQVGMAWNLYANANLDAVLPGWLDIDVQSDTAHDYSWSVSYNFPDRNKVPPAPDYNENGKNLAGPWTWRLLSYLDYNLELIFGYRDEESTGVQDYADPVTLEKAEEIAFSPAFGYNAYYMGGWWELNSNYANRPPMPRYHDVGDAQANPDTGLQRPRISAIARQVSQIKDPLRLILFCTSALSERQSHNLVVPFKVDDFHLGSHYVVPPYLATTRIYGEPSPGRGDPTSIIIHTGNKYGVPIGRYNNQAVILHADGHVDAQTPGALADMRWWVNDAPKSMRQGKHWQHTESMDIPY